MTHAECYCGVDVGTQGVRAVLVDPEGTELGAAAVPLTGSVRSGVRHEQSPEHWWQAVAVAVRHALDRAADRCGGPVRPLALAIDSTSGTVLVEAPDGTPRGPALMYDDARAAAQAERVAAAGSAYWRELGHRVQPTWALPKVLWLLENGAVGPGGRVVHQADHLVRRLVGDPVATDTSHALKTGADPRTGRWPLRLLAELGIGASTLPALVVPGTVLGRVSRQAASATGLPVDLPVRAGMTDGCAAQIAANALAPGRWSSALGTTLVVKGSTTERLLDPDGAVYCHRHPDGGWLPGGASSTGAGALTRLLPDHADLDHLTELASRRPPVAAVTYPLAGHGERFPFVAPEAEGFVPAGLDDVDRFAALCQGIAFVERLSYDVLGGLGADTSGPVSLTGGASVNRWWNQLRTDVLDRPTTRPRSPHAATGMAVLAAAEPGRLTETAERMTRTHDWLEPDPERAAGWDASYLDLVAALADRGWLDHDVAGRVLAPVGVR